MDKNKGIIFGVFIGIALCVLFYVAFASYPVDLMGPVILTLSFAAVAIFLLLAVVAIFVIAKKATVSEDKGIERDELRERLVAVEQRLTEVQDVMIALSEKIDRMEGAGAEPWSAKNDEIKAGP